METGASASFYRDGFRKV